MTFRILWAFLGLIVIVCSAAAQNPAASGRRTVPTTLDLSGAAPSVPSAPETNKVAALTPLPPTVLPAGEQKLTDARRIATDLARGNVRVVVTLSPPPALAQTDFGSKASLAALRPQIKNLQQGVIATLPAVHVKVGRLFDNVAGFSAEVSADGLRALQAHPQVVSIEPVFVLQPHLAQGISLIHGMTYRSTYNGAGLAIAICDTGIDYNHPRLGGGGFPNGKVIGGYDFGDDDADPIPGGEAHGTCCAGIAAGDLGTVGDYIGGVAYNSKLYALKITSGTGGNATTADMVAAWDWCVTHKNDSANYPIMVISTSFGGGQYFSTCDSVTPSMTTAANNAVAAGMTVLASSGNDGYCDSLGWPSCISSVISVGAVYDASFGHFYPCLDAASCAPKISTGGCATHYYADDLTAADKVTSYANVASFLTLLAPGNQCYTLDITGAGGYDPGDYYSEFGGTSAACPYAAGAVACLQSAAKELTGNYLSPQEVRSRLLAYGDNITDTKVAITKPRVNLESAILSLGTNPVLNIVSATLLGGNGNQSVDPNECNDLRIIVRNDGLSTATNISATLTTSTPGVTIVPPNSAYPNLARAAMATNQTLFRVITSPSFVCGTPVSFVLVLSYGGGTNTDLLNLSSGSADYILTSSSGAAIVPGTTDIGNHGDDVTTSIALPFVYSLYGQNFTSATVSANGNLQFAGANAGPANACLPVAGFANTIFAFWDDLRTDGVLSPAQGIYTSIGGIAPNRIFNIEWRASYFAQSRRGNPVNFEIRLYENQQRFDIIYGALNGSGSSATIGVQREAGGAFTQFGCNSGGLSDGLQLTFQKICDSGGGACGQPTAGFTASPTNGSVPLTVAFADLSSGATSYSWDFGDAQTSTAANAAHTYTNAGSFTVKLTAMNSTGTNTLTRANYIIATNVPPAFSVQPQSRMVAAGSNVAFNVTVAGTPPLNYRWRFLGASIAGATSSGFTRTNAQCADVGGYDVVVTNMAGSVTSSVALLTVIAPPVISTQPGNQIVLQGENASFAVLATNDCGSGLTFQWRFNGAGIPGATSSGLTRTGAQQLDAGNYSVVVSNFAGSVTSSVATLTVLAPPVSHFLAGVTNGVVPLTVYFTNQSSGATRYTWDFGDGNSSTNENAFNLYTNAGPYSISLTAMGAGGTNVFTRTNYIVATNLPAIITPATLDFGIVLSGQTAQASFVVTNPGATLLNMIATTTQPFALLDAGALAIPSLVFEVPIFSATNIAVLFAPTNSGAFSNTVLFASASGDVTCAVSGRGFDRPLIVSVTPGGPEFTFSFVTSPGLSYEVQYKDSLDAPLWETLTTIPGDGALKTITNSLAAPSQRFFRLSVNKP